jgi:hypothetical protein
MKRLVRLCVLSMFAVLMIPSVAAQGIQLDTRRDFQRPVQRLPLQAGVQDGPLVMADNGHGMRLAAWAYRSGLEIDVALSLRIGNTWGPVELFGQGNGLIDYEPDLAFLPDGRPVLAWTQRDARTGRSDVVFSMLTAEGWQAPERINQAGTNASSPHLVPSLGQLSVVFADASGQLVSRTFTTSAADEDETQGNSGSNGPDPMPNIRIPPEGDPNEFPIPRERFPLTY